MSNNEKVKLELLETLASLLDMSEQDKIRVGLEKMKIERMNQQNGLCLSALHDRAYDLGLITVMPDFKVRVSEKLKLQTEDAFMKQSLLRFNNKKILMPVRYGPDPALLESHARRFGFL